MKISNVSRREFCIELPGLGPKAVKQFRAEALEYFNGNTSVEKVLRDDRYLLSGLEQAFKVRIATPKEFGYESDLFPWAADTIAEKNGLDPCASFIPVRIALEFDILKPQLPVEYTQLSWFVHMSQIPDCMTGQMFISGFGCPNPVFKIRPAATPAKYVLDVEWVYGGRRSEISKDQSILFQCK